MKVASATQVHIVWHCLWDGWSFTGRSSEELVFVIVSLNFNNEGIFARDTLRHDLVKELMRYWKKRKLEESALLWG